VEWLFPAGAPFTGSDDQLTAARETFEQQMRAALMTAYSVDTILQFPVQWNSTLPAGAAGQISLYGQVQPLGMLSGSAGFSSAEIDIPEHGGPGLLTFLYSAPDIAETAQISVDLQLNVTHIQVFTEPPSATPPDEARPSLWLQLIPGADGSPTSTHIGPAGTPTVVPLVFRQYPTPPTIISQSGQAPGDSTGTKQCNLHNVLSQSAAWHYTLNYQAQITPHDRLLAYVTYNTVTSNGGAVANAAFGAPVQYTLFQALARFNAAWAVLQPIIVDPTNTNFAATAGAFAQLVSDVVNNSDWNPVPGFSLQAGKQTVTDQYAVTDQPVQQSTSRLITLTWPQIESSFPAATISVQAIAPDGNSYPGQIAGTVTNGITDSYVPTTPLSGDWVSHQIEIDCLNVLSAENARPAVQIERNLIVLPGTQNTSWTVLSEFIYMTAMVSASQPVTPFVDNSIPINVAQLPNQGANARCPASPSSLCQRVYTILNDLLTDPGQLTARKGASDGSAIYRVKMGCGFAWPITAATGTAPGLDPITPVVPVVLARSFDIDVSVPDQMETFASSFANAISSWAGANTVLFGAMAQPAGGQLIFDVTLFAQLSGNNRPLLRLRNLQLALTDVETTSR
jgi:hypothetical protein